MNSHHAAGFLLVLCYLGFVSLGLPDTVIGIAWPSIRQEFGLPHGAMSWIFVGTGCSYFFSSFFAGRLLSHMNVGTLLAASSGLVALAAFDYGMATVWILFAAGALLHGLGSGAIDAGLNHYVSSHFSARHMNWLHACYSVGAMLGPIIMTAMITTWASWRGGYLVVAASLLTLALLFGATRRQWEDRGSSPSVSPVLEPNKPTTVSTRDALGTPGVWMHIALFFVYTGLEVMIGQWSFTVLTQSRGVDVATAGAWVTIYWAAILAGRIIFGFVVDRLGIDRLIRGSVAVTIAGTLVFAMDPTPFAAPIALGLCGFGLAAIYPCLMTRTPERFGKAVASHAIGFQVGAAMIGAAALPSAAAVIAQWAGVAMVPTVILVTAFTLLVLHEAMLRMAIGRVVSPS